MNPIDKVLGALDRVKKDGRGWKACCPAHDDRNPSLSINEGDNGTVLIKCWAGCDVASVIGAMGLEMSDLFPPRDRESRGNGRDQFDTRPQRMSRHNPAQRMKVQSRALQDSGPLSTNGPEHDFTEPRLFTLARYGTIERKPIDWLIRGYLVRDTLAGLIAPPGTCKSFLAVDWACRIATGTPWHGRAVKAGVVFYLAGEGQAGLAKRIEGWEIANQVDAKDAPLFVSSGLPFLCDADNVSKTIEILEETADALFFQSGLEPALIVVDTVARAMNGANENATDDMGRFVAAKDALRSRWGCTVLSVHHTGHDAGAQKRGRGSSNYGANLDSDFYLANKGELVLLSAGDKAKDWPTPPSVTLSRMVVTTSTIGEDGKAETTLTLHDATGDILSKTHSQRDQALQMRERGLSERVIADTLGVAKTTVHRWLQTTTEKKAA